MSAEKDELLSLERGFWTKANDPEYFQATLADDSISVIEPMGFIEKAQAVKFSGQGKPFRDVRMHDVLVRELGPDTMVLAYHGEGTPEGSDQPYRASICSVYSKRDGRWKLALTAHQPWKPDDE